MTQQDYTAPKYRGNAFNCPYCRAYAHQRWLDICATASLDYQPLDSCVSQCACCEKFSYWIEKKLAYPPQCSAPFAAEDMPRPVKKYYDEARLVSTVSARAAAALLRIAVKKLCEHLGESESNLNHAINNLQKKGLPERVIKSLDTVRIVGNEGGAHEGQIDLTGEDNKEIVDKLFWLINFIVQKTITEPKEVDDTFNALPEDKKQGVTSRNQT